MEHTKSVAIGVYIGAMALAGLATFGACRAKLVLHKDVCTYAALMMIIVAAVAWQLAYGARLPEARTNLPYPDPISVPVRPVRCLQSGPGGVTSPILIAEAIPTWLDFAY